MLRFSKLVALGNDFVLIDRRAGGDPLPSQRVAVLCDRHRGIGADGILSLWPDESCDARMQIQNADGSEAGMCGNGLRCAARFLIEKGQAPAAGTDLRIRTTQGPHRCTRVGSDQFRVEMGVPRFQDPDLPPDTGPGGEIALRLGEREIAGTCLVLGNPHLVLFEEKRPIAERLAQERHLLESHPSFRNRVNVTWARPEAGGFSAVVFERGVGPTQSCGSAACAVGVAAVRLGLAAPARAIPIRFPGGTLRIFVDRGGNVEQEGEALWVFDGEVTAL